MTSLGVPGASGRRYGSYRRFKSLDLSPRKSRHVPRDQGFPGSELCCTENHSFSQSFQLGALVVLTDRNSLHRASLGQSAARTRLSWTSVCHGTQPCNLSDIDG